jgi:sugar lactone lactonase YvrE
MKTNNTNDFSKRTQSQIASILIANGVSFKPENLGDGRTFYINDTSIKTRFAIKKAGFILEVSKSKDKGLIFKTH